MNPSYQNTILDLGLGRQNNVTRQYRRNGKLQSCEPCRKSKLRCDHVVPACGRCVKRRRTDQCVYHPAPLTQKRDQSSQVLPSPTSSSPPPVPDVVDSIEARFSGQLPRLLSSQPQPFNTLSPRARAASAPVALDDYRDSVAKGYPGFLGSTSYSAVFEADLEHLGVAASDLRSHDVVEAVPMSSEKLLRGRKVLSLFKDSLMVNRFMNKYQEISDNSGEVVIFPMVRHWLKDLWMHHRETLKDHNPDAIRRLCELLWRNTQTQISYDGDTTPQTFASLCSGHNLRWEVIGIIVTDIGLAAQTTHALDDMFREHNITREGISKLTHEALEACLSFCRECGAHDDLFLWFLNQTSWLDLSLNGVGSYAAYQRTGELANAMLAMGFQQEIKADARTPFFLAELRKRNRISVYAQEVALASMLGRPCRLSYRYSNMDLPLDLTDAELFLEGPQLQAALAKLDGNGWRFQEHLHRIAFMRANMIHGPRREDIIDISLGNYTPEEIMDRVAKIRSQYEADWATAPDYIRRKRDIPADKSKSLIHALYTNVVRHGYTANELLLQRVLIRKLGASADELIHFARLIFKDIMALSGRHEMLTEYRMDFVWLLASHGLRAAAILAVELYKQEQLPVYPTNPRLPRPETIRELSVFVERLSAIEDNGVDSFTEQARKVISSILDKILAPPRHAPAAAEQDDPAAALQVQQQQHVLDPLLGDVESMNFGALDASLNFGPDADFMNWLGTMDLDKQGQPGASSSGFY